MHVTLPNFGAIIKLKIEGEWGIILLQRCSDCGEWEPTLQVMNDDPVYGSINVDQIMLVGVEDRGSEVFTTLLSTTSLTKDGDTTTVGNMVREGALEDSLNRIVAGWIECNAANLDS